MTTNGTNHGTQKLAIKGMTCQHCAATVERALSRVPGVERVRVHYLRKEAEVHGQVDTQALVEAVEGVGYQAVPNGASAERVSHA